MFRVILFFFGFFLEKLLFSFIFSRRKGRKGGIIILVLRKYYI